MHNGLDSLHIIAAKMHIIAVFDTLLNYSLRLRMPCIVGYKLAQDRCCNFETNSTETTCIMNVTALPSSVMGGESTLVFQLLPTDYNVVSSQSQMFVFVDHIVAGMWVACIV